MRVRTRRRVPYINQMIPTECGLCCCAMILRYYRSNESLLDLREYFEVGRDGLSMRQIQKIFMSKGFESKMYKVSVEQLRNLKTPLIAHWNNDHFIVLERITSSHVQIVNPSTGRQKLTLEEFEKSFTNYVLTAATTEVFVPQDRRGKSPWHYVLRIIYRKKLQMLTALLLSIVSYTIMLKIPQLVERIIDKALSAPNPIWLDTYVGIIAGIGLLYLLVVLTRGLSYIYLNLSVSRALITGTFKHLLKLPFKFFDVRTSGDLMYRLGSLNGLRELITTQLIGGLVDLGSILFILYYMLNKSIMLTAVALGIFMLNLVFMLVTRKPLSDSINDELNMQSKSQSIQIEVLYSMPTIKITGIEDEMYQTWNKSFAQVLAKYKSRSVLQNVYSSVNTTFQTIGPLILLLIGMFISFQNKMTLGEVVAFQALSVTFFGLSTSLFGVYTQYLLATNYIARVNDIWEQRSEDIPDQPVSLALTGKVELKNVSFAYTKHAEKVLSDIDICIEAGQKVAIVGASGSGKSTLSKLMVGLYSPTSGDVLFDDISIKQLDKRSLCGQIGIVPQDIMLLNKSIYENIVMNKEVGLDEVILAAKITQIDDEIQAMPMKYNTIVSEMGMNLSGGQRQRIALARALLNHPKIIILDEATSSLDSINEFKISSYLKNAGCTRIVIAHRLTTIMDSDMILVMENGRIAEQGNHEELMSRDGIYKELYSVQEDGFVDRELMVLGGIR